MRRRIIRRNRPKPKRAKGLSVSHFGSNIRHFVFGVEDGLVSTLGVITGVSTGAADTNFVILAGLAAAFTGATSMAAGTFLSTKSQKDYYDRLLGSKIKGIDGVERKEMRALHAEHENPLRAAIVIWVSFMLSALVPILPFYFAEAPLASLLALIFTTAALFIFGATRALYTKRKWYYGAFEMVAIGLLAAAVGFAVGSIFRIW